jgi:hypothetical protein
MYPSVMTGISQRRFKNLLYLFIPISEFYFRESIEVLHIGFLKLKASF